MSKTDPLSHIDKFRKNLIETFIYGRRKENAGNKYFLPLSQCFLPYERQLSCFNPFSNKPWFKHVCSTSLLKTLWEKEKLLVTSNFSISHRIFDLLREHSVILIEF